LAQLAVALYDFDEVEHDAFFDAEHEIEVPQADVGIDERNSLPALGEGRAEICRRRGFPHAAFPRSDDDSPSAQAR
jgi:hypothetical protein